MGESHKAPLTDGRFRPCAQWTRKVLQKYGAGDTIFVYASGFGAIGFGRAVGSESHRLMPVARHGSDHRHEADVQWGTVAEEISDGISTAELRDLGLAHPRQTSEEMDADKAQILIAALNDKFGEIAFAEELSASGTSYPEGYAISRLVNGFERNRRARDACIALYGTSCLACGFNFEREYGEIGHGIIHVHHSKPLSEIREEYRVSPIDDLVPVCPNCHLMLHQRKPNPYSIEELVLLIQASKNRS